MSVPITELEEVARRIARLDRNWAKTGLACRDPVTGITFRRGVRDTWSVDALVEHTVVIQHKLVSPQAWGDCVDRAQDAGPAYTDATTLGYFLFHLLDHFKTGGIHVWGVHLLQNVGSPYIPLESTTALAILRATAERLEQRLLRQLDNDQGAPRLGE